VESIPDAPSARREREAVRDYISAAPAVPQPPAPAAQISSTPPKGTSKAPTQRQNIQAIGELIKQLLAAGVDLKTIQARMKTLTGCENRAQLNGGQAVVLIEEFESWLDVLEGDAEGFEEVEGGAE